MSDAATHSGAADGKDQPAAATTEGRPILRQSRAEMMDTIGRRRVENFNTEQKEAGSTEFVPVTGELKDEDDVDLEDQEAEEERKRLERESADADKRERAAKKAEKDELAKQLAADDRVTVIEDPSKFRVKMKVDGEEQIVSLADMTRTAQKEAAADRRLEQAAQMMKAAEQREAEAAAKLAAADEAGKAKAERELKAAQEDKEQAKKGLQEKLKRHSELLYEGKVEEASKVMSEILDPVYERSAAPTQKGQEFDEEALTKRVIAAVKPQVKQDLKSESALETFREGYPEIVADPHLAAIADGYFDTALKEGKSEAESLKIAGESTRGYLKKIAKDLGMSEGRRQTTTGRESLAARKESIDEPESASAATSLKDTSPPEPNARQAIAEMAASRPGAMAATAAAKRLAGGG